MPCKHQLSNPLTVFNNEILIGKIDEDDAHFPPVVSIYGTRGIQHGHALLCGKPAPGTDLNLVSCRNFEENACRDHRPSEGLQHYGFREGGSHIHAGRKQGGICRERISAAVYYFNGHTYKYTQN